MEIENVTSQVFPMRDDDIARDELKEERKILVSRDSKALLQNCGYLAFFSLLGSLFLFTEHSNLSDHMEQTNLNFVDDAFPALKDYAYCGDKNLLVMTDDGPVSLSSCPHNTPMEEIATWTVPDGSEFALIQEDENYDLKLTGDFDVTYRSSEATRDFEAFLMNAQVGSATPGYDCDGPHQRSLLRNAGCAGSSGPKVVQSTSRFHHSSSAYATSSPNGCTYLPNLALSDLGMTGDTASWTQSDTSVTHTRHASLWLDGVSADGDITSDVRPWYITPFDGVGDYRRADFVREHIWGGSAFLDQNMSNIPAHERAILNHFLGPYDSTGLSGTVVTAFGNALDAGFGTGYPAGFYLAHAELQRCDSDRCKTTDRQSLFSSHSDYTDWAAPSNGVTHGGFFSGTAINDTCRYPGQCGIGFNSGLQIPSDGFRTLESCEAMKTKLIDSRAQSTAKSRPSFAGGYSIEQLTLHSSPYCPGPATSAPNLRSPAIVATDWDSFVDSLVFANLVNVFPEHGFRGDLTGSPESKLLRHYLTPYSIYDHGSIRNPQLDCVRVGGNHKIYSEDVIVDPEPVDNSTGLFCTGALECDTCDCTMIENSQGFTTQCADGSSCPANCSTTPLSVGTMTYHPLTSCEGNGTCLCSDDVQTIYHYTGAVSQPAQRTTGDMAVFSDRQGSTVGGCSHYMRLGIFYVQCSGAVRIEFHSGNTRVLMDVDNTVKRAPVFPSGEMVWFSYTVDSKVQGTYISDEHYCPLFPDDWTARAWPFNERTARALTCIRKESASQYAGWIVWYMFGACVILSAATWFVIVTTQLFKIIGTLCRPVTWSAAQARRCCRRAAPLAVAAAAVSEVDAQSTCVSNPVILSSPLTNCLESWNVTDAVYEKTCDVSTNFATVLRMGESSCIMFNDPDGQPTGLGIGIAYSGAATSVAASPLYYPRSATYKRHTTTKNNPAFHDTSTKAVGVDQCLRGAKPTNFVMQWEDGYRSGHSEGAEHTFTTDAGSLTTQFGRAGCAVADEHTTGNMYWTNDYVVPSYFAGGQLMGYEREATMYSLTSAVTRPEVIVYPLGGDWFPNMTETLIPGSPDYFSGGQIIIDSLSGVPSFPFDHLMTKHRTGPNGAIPAYVSESGEWSIDGLSKVQGTPGPSSFSMAHPESLSEYSVWMTSGAQVGSARSASLVPEYVTGGMHGRDDFSGVQQQIGTANAIDSLHVRMPWALPWSDQQSSNRNGWNGPRYDCHNCMPLGKTSLPSFMSLFNDKVALYDEGNQTADFFATGSEMWLATTAKPLDYNGWIFPATSAVVSSFGSAVSVAHGPNTAGAVAMTVSLNGDMSLTFRSEAACPSFSSASAVTGCFGCVSGARVTVTTTSTCGNGRIAFSVPTGFSLSESSLSSTPGTQELSFFSSSSDINLILTVAGSGGSDTIAIQGTLDPVECELGPGCDPPPAPVVEPDDPNCHFLFWECPGWLSGLNFFGVLTTIINVVVIVLMVWVLYTIVRVLVRCLHCCTPKEHRL